MAIVDRYAGLIFDLDGVVFHLDRPIREAVAFLRRALRNGRRVVFVSNNAARERVEWARLLADAKVTVPEEDILTSAVAAVALLASEQPPPRCLVIGGRGLRSALSSAGVPTTEEPAEADVVVVGWDPGMTYDRLRAAATAIRRGARFIGTNPDPVLPTPDGPWPGAGATLSFLRTATGVAPEIVGKPQRPLFELARQRLGVDGPVLVVGDQLTTDVLGAHRMGWDAALVLTGVSDTTALVDAPVLPRWVVRHAGELDGPEPPTIRAARESDLSAIMALLEEAGWDPAGAAARLTDTLVAEAPDGRVVGTASWERYGRTAHLRGVVVTAAERGHGTGSQLVAYALNRLKHEGVEWVYLLTPGAEDLFERLGFRRVSRDRVPAEILATATYGPPDRGGVALVRRLAASGPVTDVPEPAVVGGP